MSWLSRFFGEDNTAPVQDSVPVETHKPGEYKVKIITTAQSADKFIVRANVYIWGQPWGSLKDWGWRLVKFWDWTTDLKSLDTTEAGALEYAQQYIENTRRNKKQTIYVD